MSDTVTVTPDYEDDRIVIYITINPNINVQPPVNNVSVQPPSNNVTVQPPVNNVNVQPVNLNPSATSIIPQPEHIMDNHHFHRSGLFSGDWG